MRYRMLPLLLLLLLLLVIVINAFSSCSTVQEETLLPELERAEAIMYQHPDSALRILEEMSVPASSDGLQHATWCLLITQARYKNYIKQSDSLVNIAFYHFIKTENSQRKALSLYLQGAINEEIKKFEKAIELYISADKEIKKTNDYQLGHLISVGLGRIYVFRNLLEYAQDAYQIAYQYALSSENEIYIANSLSHLGRVNSAINDWEKSILYYKEGMKIAKEQNFIRILNTTLTELAGVYLEIKQYQLSLQYAYDALSLQNKNKLGTSQSSFIIGGSYYYISKYDSANYYLNKAINSTSIYTRRNATQLLYDISKEKKDFLNALEYSEQLLYYTDSIRKMDRIAALTDMQEKYNQEKVINEKNLLQIEKDRTIRNGLFILVILLCTGGITIYFYQRKIVLKERTIQKKEDQIRLYLLKVHENEVLINKNRERIQELKMEVEEQYGVQKQLEEQESAIKKIQMENENLLSENKQLQNNVNLHADSLQKQSAELNILKKISEENLFLRDREKFLCQELLKKTKALNDLKKTPKYLDAMRWAEVIQSIDWLYTDFTRRLTKELPSLTESDLQICCLIKMRFAIPEIAIMLGISPTSVSKRKLRLKERIIHDIGTPFSDNLSIDLWIWDY